MDFDLLELSKNILKEFKFSPILWNALIPFVDGADGDKYSLYLKTAWDEKILLLAPKKEVIKKYNEEDKEPKNSKSFWAWLFKEHTVGFIKSNKSDFFDIYDTDAGEAITMYLRQALSNDTDVFDSGRYISGSKKEANLIRKLLSNMPKDQEELTKSQQLDVAYKKLSGSISDFKEAASVFFYKDSDDSNVILWSAPIGIAYRMHDAWTTGGTNFKKNVNYNLNRYAETYDKVIEIVNDVANTVIEVSNIFTSDKVLELINYRKKVIQKMSDEKEEVDGDFFEKNSDIIDDVKFEEKINKLMEEVVKALFYKMNSLKERFADEAKLPSYYTYLLAELTNSIKSLEYAGSRAERYLYIDNEKLMKKMAVKKAKSMGDAELYKFLTGRKLIPNFERKGGREINAKIDVDTFLGKFNLSGQEFGKALKDKDRLELLKRAESGFMDLADILGVEDNRLGLKGSLGFALASRGKGGKGAALAHYEPLQKVINLTKSLGTDGSLAHEFGHAFDFGPDGKSFFEKNIDELDDLEIKDAFLNLKKSIYSSSKADFLAWVEQEKDYYEAEAKKSKEKYHELKNKAGEVRDKIGKQMHEIRDFFLNKKIDISLMSEKDVEKIEEEHQGLFYKFIQLKEDQKINYRIILHHAEPFRLYHNLCNKKAFALRSLDGQCSGTKDFNSLRRSIQPELGFLKSLDVEDGLWPSVYLINASMVDDNSSKKSAYWSSGVELFARAFESFVTDKMEDEERTNSFLINKERARTDGRVSTYPKGAERYRISEAMEYFVGVLQKKGYF